MILIIRSFPTTRCFTAWPWNKIWIPPEVFASKEQVRNYLRRSGQEEAWTELQGFVYGARLCDAAAFPGAIEFFRKCREQEVPVCIISHKTRHPFRGPAYDLHQAALDWLTQNGFFDPAGIGLPREAVHLETTLAGKLQRIADRGCTHFIDDLPELLSEPAFPVDTQAWLFDPNHHHSAEQRFARATSWPDLDELLLCGVRSHS